MPSSSMACPGTSCLKSGAMLYSATATGCDNWHLAAIMLCAATLLALLILPAVDGLTAESSLSQTCMAPPARTSTRISSLGPDPRAPATHQPLLSG